MIKYTFVKQIEQLGEVLVCPECEETLSQIDISNYGSCPYCDNNLTSTPELEDYLLKPAIDQWVSMQDISIPVSLGNLIIPDEVMFK